MVKFRKIGVLTSGGDAPGMNAVVRAVTRSALAKNIEVVVHIINGLPYETKEMMIETVKYLNDLKINGIKIHMLHIMKNTPLEKYYQENPFFKKSAKNFNGAIVFYEY